MRSFLSFRFFSWKEKKRQQNPFWIEHKHGNIYKDYFYRKFKSCSIFSLTCDLFTEWYQLLLWCQIFLIICNVFVHSHFLHWITTWRLRFKLCSEIILVGWSRYLPGRWGQHRWRDKWSDRWSGWSYSPAGCCPRYSRPGSGYPSEHIAEIGIKNISLIIKNISVWIILKHLHLHKYLFLIYVKIL